MEVGIAITILEKCHDVKDCIVALGGRERAEKVD